MFSVSWPLVAVISLNKWGESASKRISITDRELNVEIRHNMGVELRTNWPGPIYYLTGLGPVPYLQQKQTRPIGP